MVDVIFFTLPGVEVRTPLIAPALLKTTVEQQGFTSKCIDLNIELWHYVDRETQINWNNLIEHILVNEKELDALWDKFIHQFMLTQVDRIRALNARWFAINVFSRPQKRLAYMFCKFFRTHFPDVKIMTGGGGLVDEKWISKKIIDVYVKSEGEKAIIEILKGNLDYPGINGIPPQQLEDMGIVPCPDYRDYDFSLYTGNEGRWTSKAYGVDFLYMSGSRGCVKDCTFCDVAFYWPKYRYRPGRNIADEMMTLSQRHPGLKLLEFTDSLFNGSMKQMREMCEAIIEYKEKGLIHPDIKWGGQAIVRPERQCNEEIWKLMTDAGGELTHLGIESGSERVRRHMRKFFTDEDLDFTMRMIEKYDWKVTMLMVVGYPTETEEDFQQTLDMFSRYAHMKNNIAVNIGRTFHLDENMPLWHQREELGVELYRDDHNGKRQWKVGNFDYEARLRRLQRAYEHIDSLGLRVNLDKLKAFMEITDPSKKST